MAVTRSRIQVQEDQGVFEWFYSQAVTVKCPFKLLKYDCNAGYDLIGVLASYRGRACLR